MCRATRCKTCGKATWAGCGRHVNQVRATVPPDQWCDGHPKGEHPGGGFLSRLLRRR